MRNKSDIKLRTTLGHRVVPGSEVMANQNRQMKPQSKKAHTMNNSPMLAGSIATLNLDPIKIKLMDKKEGKGWTRAQADAAEIAYKQFLQLNLKYPKQSIVPTVTIDAFWHQHILDTQKYAEDCQNIFGYFLHHFPYFGMRGKADAENLKNAFDETKELFASEFAEENRIGCIPDHDGLTVYGLCSGTSSCEGGGSCTGTQCSVVALPKPTRPTFDMLNDV